VLLRGELVRALLDEAERSVVVQRRLRQRIRFFDRADGLAAVQVREQDAPAGVREVAGPLADRRRDAPPGVKEENWRIARRATVLTAFSLADVLTGAPILVAGPRRKLRDGS
jgi:hypothetical protein